MEQKAENWGTKRPDSYRVDNVKWTIYLNLTTVSSRSALRGRELSRLNKFKYWKGILKAMRSLLRRDDNRS